MQNDKEQIQKFEEQIERLEEIGKRILNLENDIKELKLAMDVHINYVAKLFSLRQFTQLSAMLSLKNNENIILISRSMFEGAVYLGCFVQNTKLAEDWRFYCYVIDQQRVDATTNKAEVPLEVMNELAQKKPIIDGFKNPKGKFYTSWTKGKTIKELSSMAQLEHFYREYYSSMSDFHHWGTKSFGIRYKCLPQSIEELSTAEIKLDCLNAWCMAISSILLVLKTLTTCSNNSNLQKNILLLEKDLEQVEGFKKNSINYENP